MDRYLVAHIEPALNPCSYDLLTRIIRRVKNVTSRFPDATFMSSVTWKTSVYQADVITFSPLAPCGLVWCASGQALDPWVPCLPVDPGGQAGPCPLCPLSFLVLLGDLVRTDGYSGEETHFKLVHDNWALLTGRFEPWSPQSFAFRNNHCLTLSLKVTPTHLRSLTLFQLALLSL